MDALITSCGRTMDVLITCVGAGLTAGIMMQIISNVKNATREYDEACYDEACYDEACYDEACYDEECYDEECYDEECYDDSEAVLDSLEDKSIEEGSYPQIVITI